MKRFLTITTLLFLILETFGQTEHFSKENFVLNTHELKYRFAKPKDYNADEDKKYPLIIFLHGAGERGNDNEKQLTHIAKIFGSNDFREKHKCFIIVPQCPKKQRWVEVDWSLMSHTQPEEMSEPLWLTSLLLIKIAATYPIDNQRVYVAGLSMGGYGTWDLISRFPETFAGAIPICGGGDENFAKKLTNIGIWAFHGKKDRVVPVERSRNMIAEIEKHGGKPKYTEYPNKGHLVWNEAFVTNGIWEWLFAQKLNDLQKN